MSLSRVLKFLIPSMIGVLLFLFPVSYDGNTTIFLAVTISILRSPFEQLILEIIVTIVILSALASGYYQIAKTEWKHSSKSFHIICYTSFPWFLTRLLGAVLAIIVYFQIGPEFIWGKETGFTVFTEIGATIFFIITVACFLMPFLTEFGFMEFIGTMVSRPFGLLFNLPGRSAIDALASFLTASNVGLLITIGQYESGYYTTRQAAAIATNFSVVSVSFSLLIATVSGIEHLFINWYISIFIACMICTVILVRIPPISRLANEYHGGKEPIETDNENGPMFKTAIRLATERAAKAPSPFTIFKNSWYSAISVIFGVLAPSMAVGTLTIIFLNHTPIFDILSMPILLIFEMIDFPEASRAAPGMIIGFLDQFMPAIVASNIENELVKFVLAGLGITQLIYMSEVGLIILRSSIPLNFIHLFIIFLLRSIISFPVLIIAGMIVI